LHPLKSSAFHGALLRQLSDQGFGVGSYSGFATKNQSHVCLEFLAKKFKRDITDERGYRGDYKIGSGKNISDCPSYAPLLPHPRALKFSHQEIGIKQEDDKSHLDHRSPDIFLHGKYRLLGRAARLGAPLLRSSRGNTSRHNEQPEWKVSQSGAHTQ
jgi:hypothetical protein